MPPLVVLIGPPGAGKSTVGRKLATKLGVGFLDTDAEIERESGRSISEIFATDGESSFREIESAVVQSSLMNHEGVLSLGGGAVLSPATREALLSLTVVWLDLPTQIAWRRLTGGRPRPLMIGMTPEKLEDFLAGRRPFYEEVATWRVESSEGSPDKAVSAIERLLHAA